ncbi:MAG: fatty acid--CoA ligase family protein [Thermoleophilia bacterium]|nr:fatty acid--CoA ligase family protein [Thermoleophilia bacterium]
MGSEFAAARGELLAVDVPAGPAWLPLLHRLWSQRIAFMPLDERLPEPERRRQLDIARPAAVLGVGGGLTVYAGAAPVDPDVAIVVATSGTSGSPRLVELSREAVVAAVEGSRAALSAAGLEVGGPLVSCLTPAHIGGLLVLLRSEVSDLPIAVHERFDAERIVRASPPGASVSLVPAMLARLVRAGADLGRFGSILVGGGSLEAELRADAETLGARLVETYGLTESCGGVVYDGIALPDSEVRVGEGGRIELRGPTIMQGYRHDPASTGAAFDVQGWLRTGDAGTIDGEGRLRVEGRLDDAIRTGAETVWPDEVEHALVSHPGVAEVAVAGRPHPEWGQQVVAFVVPRAIDDAPSLEELRDHASERIARHKAPRELVLVAELPRTPGGKLRRDQLPDR